MVSTVFQSRMWCSVVLYPSSLWGRRVRTGKVNREDSLCVCVGLWCEEEEWYLTKTRGGVHGALDNVFHPIVKI